MCVSDEAPFPSWVAGAQSCTIVCPYTHVHTHTFLLVWAPSATFKILGGGNPWVPEPPPRTWHLADVAVCGGRWDTRGASAPSNLPWPFFHQPLTCQPLPPRSWVSWTAVRPSLPLAKHAAPPPPGCDDGCQRGASLTAWGEDSFSPAPAGHQPSDPSLQGTPDFVFAVNA